MTTLFDARPVYVIVFRWLCTDRRPTGRTSYAQTNFRLDLETNTQKQRKSYPHTICDDLTLRGRYFCLLLDQNQVQK